VTTFEVIASVGSLATAGAFWVSVKMWHQERSRLDSERKLREQEAIEDQARQVDFWIHSEKTGPMMMGDGTSGLLREFAITVSNSSAHAIRNVWVELDEGRQGTYVIPPTERGHFFEIDGPLSIVLRTEGVVHPYKIKTKVAITFTDINNRNWRRNQQGELALLSDSEYRPY
jgi:hypothetical protein